MNKDAGQYTDREPSSAIPAGVSPPNPLMHFNDPVTWDVIAPERQRWAGDERPTPSKSAGGERVR